MREKIIEALKYGLLLIGLAIGSTIGQVLPYLIR